jgi:hypothetical protein
VRRGEARSFLGVSEQEFTKMVESEILRPVYIVKGGRAYFMRKQVVEVAQQLENQTKN